MAETESMRRQLSTRAEYFNIIGSSKPMQTIYETIESVAKSDANVLIVGESGTGKELIANAIHYNSLRSKKPFIKVNCAALPKELIESELFGHTKGAFTGAHADKEGLVQHAAGGSLMLDEIAEMPVELQPKLLRVSAGAKLSQDRIREDLLGRLSFDLFHQSFAGGCYSRRAAARRSLLSHFDDHDSCAALARAQRRHSIAHRPFPEDVRAKIRPRHYRCLTGGLSKTCLRIPGPAMFANCKT